MANKTTFYVRIYSRHDHDLMMYYLSLRSCEGAGNREFSKVIKTVLRDYVRKRKSQIPIVKTQADIIPKGSLKIRFTLDNEEDADVIKLLRSVYKRQMNSFIKNLLRSRIEESQLESYFRASEKAALAVVDGIENRKKRVTATRMQQMNAEEKTIESVVKPEKISVEATVVPNIPKVEETIPKTSYNKSFASTPIVPQKNNNTVPGQTENSSGFNIFGALEQAMNFGQ